MSDRLFDSSDRDFTAEAELLRAAARLPKLSGRMRARVLDTATAAFREARRWTQARQAASLLSVCLFALIAISPLPEFSSATSAWNLDRPDDGVESAGVVSPLLPNSAWKLSHNHQFLELPRVSNTNRNDRLADPKSLDAGRKAPSPVVKSEPPRVRPAIVARAVQPPPSDRLLTALRHSDGWATVQAFQAVRSRSQSTLNRAFAAN